MVSKCGALNRSRVHRLWAVLKLMYAEANFEEGFRVVSKFAAFKSSQRLKVQGHSTGRNDRTYCGHNVHSGHIRYILGTY